MLARNADGQPIGTIHRHLRALAGGAFKLFTWLLAVALLRAGYARKIEDPELGQVRTNIQSLIDMLKTANRIPAVHNFVRLIALLGVLGALATVNAAYHLLMSIREGVGGRLNLKPPRGSHVTMAAMVMLSAFGVGLLCS